MTCVQFGQVSLVNASFYMTNLDGASFNGSRLIGAKFNSSSLEGVSFLNGADVNGVSFHSSNVRGAEFPKTKLAGVDFGNTDLSGAHFSNSDLSGTKITPEQIQQASFFNENLPLTKENVSESNIIMRKTTTKGSNAIEWPKPITSSSSSSAQVISDLISRVLDNTLSAKLFQVSIQSDLAVNGKDVFVLSNGSVSGSIQISASTGVAAAWGFNYYLKYVADSSVYWSGKNIRLSNSTLFPIHEPIRIVANDLYRWYGNPCTFSYSAVFWNFSRWEKEIDWMAMNGVNLVYATTGMEYIYNKVFLRMGFPQTELDDYFTGPAFLAWFRMGNLQKHGGPLSNRWHQSQFQLAKQIIQRMTDIGIIPVLPAFTGFMPRTAPLRFPSARFHNSSSWDGFGCNESCLPYLDPTDSFFQKVGVELLNETITLLNLTSHFYACDLFNEMTPPTSDLEYLADVNAGIFQAMKTVDPDAVWVMQAWLFLSKFWKPDRVQSYLSKVPIGHLILLDLFSESSPQYSRFESFYGHYYIWNMLHDFGGNNFLFGSLVNVTKGPQTARNFSGDQMIGVGITMEGINQNEIMYEFALEQSWRSPLNDTELNDWLVGFVLRRYESAHPVPSSALYAWQLLGDSVYGKNPNGDSSVMLSRPELDGEQDINFDLKSLFSAWELLVDASDELHSDLFRYDLVDITKEVLQYKFYDVYTKLISAFNDKDLYGVGTQAAILVDILADTELILASDRRFLLGNWINDALQFAQNEEDIHFYNFNAKLQVSIWGNNYTLELYDYANKFWSGMIRDYYAPRWYVFFDILLKCLVEGHPVNQKVLNERLFLEAELPFFMLDTKVYPTTTQGDSITIARELFNKYHLSLNEIDLPETSSKKKVPFKHHFD
ncbi:unnamed protein product [Adineta steineri]|uniref:Alpha-N-acetylglucosaminidase n=1 Tax=Adineta steineri TaxID=433720 RepID=A0A814UWC8_9BILA|nr:unnamed protein product [Adineta steineri]